MDTRLPSVFLSVLFLNRPLIHASMSDVATGGVLASNERNVKVQICLSVWIFTT